MSDHPVSAPGKAFLIGEYAVLEGAPALVSAVDVRAVAHRARAEHGERPAPESSFVAAAERGVAAYLEERGLRAEQTTPFVSTVGFTSGERKLGLGSSAAVSASVIGWHLAAAGLSVENEEVRADVLRLALAAHREAQQGKGSGADVAAAVLGGTLRFVAGEDAPSTSPVATPEWLHVGFFDAGAPARTSSFVAAVMKAKDRAPRAYAAAMDALRSASESFAAGFSDEAGASAGLPRILEATKGHNAGLAQLEELADIQILTPKIRDIIRAASSAGLAAKPSGAGGGDLVVVFASDRGDLDRLCARLIRDHSVAHIGQLKIAGEGLRTETRPPANSRLQGFFKLDIATRRDVVAKATGLASERFDDCDPGRLGLDAADHMVENVIGTLELPLAVATNFRINGRDYLVPMCVEEASVVAAASNAAKMIRAGGGFSAHSDPPWMIAQIQLVRVSDDAKAASLPKRIAAERDKLLELADKEHPRLLERGGGARELEVRVLDADNVVVHVLVDCQDAMGANLINTVAEALAPRLEELTGWRAVLRILSNLADRRGSHVTARVPPRALASKEWSGDKVAARIVEASRFAELDPYRATTHNKGVMNGVDAVVLATGNDWRAMEASAHAYAARDGMYRPLAIWRQTEAGGLVGQISLPTAVGVVGGATRSHPSARLALDILGRPSAVALGQIMAAAGLASNLAALRALATDGIQRGHMTLHARAVALAAGAEGPEIEKLAKALIDVGEIKPDRASSLLREMRAERS